jgi:hypothetical protein
MGLNTGAVGQGQGSTSHYGHADYARDKAAGMSDYDIKKLIDADTSKMGNGGVTGDLYKQIAGGATPPKPSGGSGSGGGGQQMAGSQEFQNRLNDATEAYRPEEVNMDDFKYGDGGKYDHLGEDFNNQVQKEQIIKQTDPFGDSWNSVDFVGKHASMQRELQKGRGDASGIANKYIFNAAQTNPVDYQALDKQIRTNPLYSESKAELAKLQLYGDTYKQGPMNWGDTGTQKGYDAPDFSNMYDKYTKDIKDISI